MLTSSPKATVVIVNYNGAHLLPACLNALHEQAEDGLEFETIVVDNASSDGSLKLLSQDFAWVRVIANPENSGFAGGNNLALREVTTPYAVLLNNDAVPEPNWLSNLLAPFSAPGNENVAIMTGKIVFLPKFAQLELQTPGFIPGTSDTRQLGAKIHRVTVNGIDVTEKVLWEQAVYGPEGESDGRFRWSRPRGVLLLPLPDVGFGPIGTTGPDGRGSEHTAILADPVRVRISLSAEGEKPFALSAHGVSASVRIGTEISELELELEPGTPVFDVINNVGGQVFEEGSGADRGFQEIDRGQYDRAVQVFTACGNGMAMRTAIGRELGWFDDAFFMYYEDTDLSWRWRSAGWEIRYEPTAVLRHIHSASSKEWSPSWTFHVERNRLLMLTKNATPALAAHAVGEYGMHTVTQLARAARESIRTHQRPPLRSTLLRLRILGSYLLLAPRALTSRARQQHGAAIPARDLQNWLVKR